MPHESGADPRVCLGGRGGGGVAVKLRIFNMHYPLFNISNNKYINEKGSGGGRGRGRGAHAFERPLNPHL